MAVTIKGIQVNDVHVEPDLQAGGYRIKSAEYSLIGSTGKVLAKQVIGGYQGMTSEPSTQTKIALDAFAQSYIKDVQSLLGLME